MKPSQRRPVVSYLHGIYRVSERRACRVARVPVSTFRYESRQEPRMALRLRIREIAQFRVRYGYRKIRVLHRQVLLERREHESRAERLAGRGHALVHYRRAQHQQVVLPRQRVCPLPRRLVPRGRHR